MLGMFRFTPSPNRGTVHRSFLELSEAKGKVVEALRVYDDPPYGREVYIEFNDGTRLSIDVAIETSVCSKHYTEEQGDLKILTERRDRSTSKDRSSL